MAQNPNHVDPDQGAVNKLYAALGASLVISCVPSIIAALFASLLFMGSLIAAYFCRKRADEGSLLENHSTHIIRTIWIGSFVAMLFIIAASFYMLQNLDSLPMMNCIDLLVNAGTSIDASSAMNILRPCWDEYMRVNYDLFITSGAIAIGPAALYFIYRYIRGLTRAIKGYRLANVKSWF